METKHQHSEHEEKKTVYQCTMKCEGDKVYDQPGNCPKCNMNLVPLDDKSSHGHHHHHSC
ncbi:MAG: hypothetical protein GXO83_01375 [Chlorobi bacterium]|nr:hypothetical protein [Chlorobiota bacterium]